MHQDRIDEVRQAAKKKKQKLIFVARPTFNIPKCKVSYAA